MISPAGALVMVLLASEVPREVDRGVPVAREVVLMSSAAPRRSVFLPADFDIDWYVDSGHWREATNRVTDVMANTSSQSSRSGGQRVSRSILIGAAVGGGVGALAGAVHCRADCGGGRARGIAVFTPIGAAVGAGIGYLVGVVGAHAP